MSEQPNIHHLTTESRNKQTSSIHTAKTLEILQMINNEDFKVAEAVQQVLSDVETAVDFAFDSFQNKGRLIYAGAGTSGRLGMLDAVECPPTFNAPPEQVIGLIAGGPSALTRAVE